MASITVTPTLVSIQKNGDGSYDFLCAMNDASGVNRGVRSVHVATDGTLSVNNVPTGQVLTGAQMTTLNNNWTTYQTAINSLDAASKIPF